MSSLGPGQVIGGKYRLERLLARGGMGTVFVARHAQLDVPVAIKFIDPAKAGAAEVRARFAREARAAAQLRSPHVVQILDHGEDAGTPFIVMELLEGEDLGVRLRRERRLSLPATASLVTQMAKALRRAHEAGIIHRDLKPSNVFIARVDDDEVLKVLDFGLAKAIASSADGDVTDSGALLGSPHYMSPEQVRGTRQIDHRSDLWSTGVILYRCVTGKLPFTGPQVGDVVVRICTESPVKPSLIVADLSEQIDRFFERALAQDPMHRFQTARELAMEFSALASPASGAEAWGPGATRPSSSSMPAIDAGLLSELVPTPAPAPAGVTAFQAPSPAAFGGETIVDDVPSVSPTVPRERPAHARGAPLAWLRTGNGTAIAAVAVVLVLAVAQAFRGRSERVVPAAAAASAPIVDSIVVAPSNATPDPATVTADPEPVVSAAPVETAVASAAAASSPTEAPKAPPVKHGKKVRNFGY